jgi:hypothetical protein
MARDYAPTKFKCWRLCWSWNVTGIWFNAKCWVWSIWWI